MSGLPLPAEARDSCIFQNAQTGLWSQPALYTLRIECSLPRVKQSNVKVNTHVHVAPRLRIGFLAWSGKTLALPCSHLSLLPWRWKQHFPLKLQQHSVLYTKWKPSNRMQFPPTLNVIPPYVPTFLVAHIRLLRAKTEVCQCNYEVAVVLVLLPVQEMPTISKSFYLNPFSISTVLTSWICLPGAWPVRIMVTFSVHITVRVYIRVTVLICTKCCMKLLCE